MAKNVLSLDTPLSHDEMRALIREVGHELTILVQSEPGVGKSSMLRQLASELGDKYLPVYIDAPVVDIPDIMMPMVDTEQCVTRFAPNALWGLNSGKRLIIMLDELLKASGPTKLILTRLLLERTLGEFSLPEGSIVFATSNNATDGVGDTVQAHLRNRISVVSLRKPTAEEWLKNFAFPNKVSPEICAWVKQYPQCMASYLDGDAAKDNPYIFNPSRTKGGAFVSGRSLAKADAIVSRRHKLGDTATIAALAGTIGASAAKDMQAFLSVADKLPSMHDLVTKPLKVKLPTDDPSAMLILLYGCAMRVTQSELLPLLKAIDRMPKEYQLIFMRSLLSQSSKQWAAGVPEVTKWHIDNKDLMISSAED